MSVVDGIYSAESVIDIAISLITLYLGWRCYVRFRGSPSWDWTLGFRLLVVFLWALTDVFMLIGYVTADHGILATVHAFAQPLSTLTVASFAVSSITLLRACPDCKQHPGKGCKKWTP